MSSHPRGRLRGARLRSLLAVAALTGATAPAAAADAAPLPNGRAFELVSPAQTGDQLTVTGYGAQPAIIDGGKLAYGNGLTVLFADAGNGWGSIFSAQRGAAGWTQAQLDPPAVEQNGNAQYWIIDPSRDGSRTLLYSSAPMPTFTTLGPRYSGPSELTIRAADGQRTTVTSVPYGAQLIPAGSSDDLGAVAYETDRQLFGDTHTQGDQVYLWRDGQTQVAGVDGDGTPFDCGATAVLNYGYSTDSPIVTTNVVSQDGRTVVVLSAGPGPDCSAAPQLYAYSDGATRPLSTPDAGVVDPGGAQAPTFVDASPDGSAVWFTSPQQLTAADGNSGTDLYRAVLPADGSPRQLTCVSCGSGSSDARVNFFPSSAAAALAADGRRLFFLTDNPIDGVGESGGENLFMWDDGTLRLLTSSGDPAASFAFQATPDGRHLLLATNLGLTAANPAVGAPNMYVMTVGDSGATDVACASCDAGGQPSSVPLFSLQGRNKMVSDDGRSAVFSTTEALTPTAVAGLQNLYEFRDGALALLTTGASTIDPRLIGISGDGLDVYFDSYSRLTPDKQQGVDAIFDARLGGGFPTPLLPPAPCAGSSCRGPVTAPPTLPAAATVSFTDAESDAGDPPAARRATRVRIARTVVRGGAVRVDVRAPGRGRVSLSGARVRAVTRAVAKAGTYRLAATLNRGARRTLARRGSVRVRLRIGFRPAQGATSSTTVTVTVKG